MGPLRLRPAVPLCLILAELAGGCGGSEDRSAQRQSKSTVSGDQRGVLQTIDALQIATRKGDGQAICGEIFTPELARSVEAASKHSCPHEVRQRLFSPRAELAVSRDITVRGDQATAVVREQNGHVSRLVMVRRDNRWRIARVLPVRA